MMYGSLNICSPQFYLYTYTQRARERSMYMYRLFAVARLNGLLCVCVCVDRGVRAFVSICVRGGSFFPLTIFTS